MKYLVKNCVFSAVAKTVTFPVQITQDRLLLITNTTRNRIIYNFADPLTGRERYFESRIHLDW